MSSNTFSFLISSFEKEKILHSNEVKALLSHNLYVEHFLTTNDCKITIYKTQKCLVQGNGALKVMQEYFPNHLDNPNKFTQLNDDSKELCKDNFSKAIIGSDEVGVGDYFGGLCICAAYLTPKTAKQAIDLGVKDSKKLNDQQIIKIAEELIKIIDYQISLITPKEYNELMTIYKNTHIIKTIAHHFAILNLIKTIGVDKIDYVVIDQYASATKFAEYLEIAYTNNMISLPIKFCTHAENQYVAVACASIIARYYFLQQIAELSEQCGLPLPLGAWNHKVEVTARNLISHCSDSEIKTVLNKYVKVHFANTAKLLDK